MATIPLTAIGAMPTAVAVMDPDSDVDADAYGDDDAYGDGDDDGDGEDGADSELELRLSVSNPDLHRTTFSHQI